MTEIISGLFEIEYLLIPDSPSSSTLIISVRRGHEVNLEYSNKIIINKINTFFGYDVLEKYLLLLPELVYEDDFRDVFGSEKIDELKKEIEKVK